jgi:hypothetical protein
LREIEIEQVNHGPISILDKQPKDQP